MKRSQLPLTYPAETGVQFAKTSSGQFEGPSLEQFMVMVHTLAGTGIKLKVAGVKFPRPQNAFVFLLAGADRIGTRDAPAIIDSLDLLREIGMLPQLVMKLTLIHQGDGKLPL